MIFSIERLNDRFDEKEKWLGGDREKLVENYGGRKRRGGEGVYFWSDVESNQRLHCDLTLPKIGSRIHGDD